MWDVFIILVSIEFKDSAYSVVEDLHVYNVTIIKQGEPTEDIVVLIVPTTDPTSSDHAECKTVACGKAIYINLLHNVL